MPFTLGGDYIDPSELNQREKAKKPVRITKEKRKNKTVTVIANIPLNESELKMLLKDLKTRFASGGSIKDDIIILQGDHFEGVKKFLQDKQFNV